MPLRRSPDLAAFSGLLGERLRQAGLAVSADQLGRFVRATDLSVPATLDDLFFVGSTTLVTGHDQLGTYRAVFDQVFRGLQDQAEARGDPNAPPARPRQAAARRPEPSRRRQPAEDAPGSATAGGAEGSDASERAVEIVAASRLERLATTDFAALSDDELAELAQLMRQIRLNVPLRPARRRRRHRHGDRLDLRATLRRSRRTGGDPVDMVTRRAGRRPRKLVVLCDISGSMAPYSRSFLQFLHAAAGGTRAEVFSFATRLTRLTKALSSADADTALALGAGGAPDWHGGTRIGSTMKEFLDRYGRPGLARGAVVVIVSDGWDRDEPGLIGEQMARLRRLACRIVWINPRRAAPGFAPVVGGMAAALPHCDALVSGNTLASLHQAMGALAEPGGAAMSRRAAPRITRRPGRPVLAPSPPPDPRGT